MRRLLAVSALLFGVLATTACETRDRGEPVRCSVLADVPRRDTAPATRVFGPVRFRCDRPGAEKLTLTVRLEKRVDSAWTVIKTQVFALQGEQTQAKLFEYHGLHVSTTCSAGRFRTTVQWCRWSRGDVDEGSSRSPPVPDPCAPRLLEPVA